MGLPIILYTARSITDMRCVVLTAPREISVQDRPTPTITNGGDVIVRVHLSGLCGGLLVRRRVLTARIGATHLSRTCGTPGIAYSDGPRIDRGDRRSRSRCEALERRGSSDQSLLAFVRSVSHTSAVACLDVDIVGSCFYCDRGHTSRCDKSALLGTPTHDGAQAEYVRIAMADASLFRQPDDIPPQLSLLLADIIPTGYSMAHLAHQILNVDKPAKEMSGVCVVIGCGPVRRAPSRA
jgi:hypothetical protein